MSHMLKTNGSMRHTCLVRGEKEIESEFCNLSIHFYLSFIFSL
jgi:hypothetical protein